MKGEWEECGERELEGNEGLVDLAWRLQSAATGGGESSGRDAPKTAWGETPQPQRPENGLARRRASHLKNAREAPARLLAFSPAYLASWVLGLESSPQNRLVSVRVRR